MPKHGTVVCNADRTVQLWKTVSVAILVGWDRLEVSGVANLCRLNSLLPFKWLRGAHKPLILWKCVNPALLSADVFVCFVSYCEFFFFLSVLVICLETSLLSEGHNAFKIVLSLVHSACEMSSETNWSVPLLIQVFVCLSVSYQGTCPAIVFFAKASFCVAVLLPGLQEPETCNQLLPRYIHSLQRVKVRVFSILLRKQDFLVLFPAQKSQVYYECLLWAQKTDV